jgi:LytR cell envelope-related transcriptional attenuator
VDSPAPQIELVRPWRTATLVASGVAAVELIALVILGVVLLGRSLAPHVHAAAAQAARETKHAAAPAKHKADPKTAHAARILPRSKTGVLVLNGNGINGAAAEASAIVRGRGYRVAGTKNAPRTGYPTWRLMTAPGYAAEAIRFARDIDLPRTRVGPLDGMTPRQLHGAKLVLILGASR